MNPVPNMASTPDERKGLTLAALLMALVSFFCALMVHWEIFAIIVAIAAAVVALFVMTSVNRSGKSRGRALLSLLISLAAIVLAVYLLYSRVPEGEKTDDLFREQPSAALSKKSAQSSGSI